MPVVAGPALEEVLRGLADTRRTYRQRMARIAAGAVNEAGLTLERWYNEVEPKYDAEARAASALCLLERIPRLAPPAR